MSENQDRDKAIDFLFTTSALAAAHPKLKGQDPEKMFDATCEALESLGVSEEEIGEWGARAMLKMLGVTER